MRPGPMRPRSSRRPCSRLGAGLAPSAAAILVTLFSMSAALAHPHVFADAKMEIVGDGHGHLAEIRNIWSMDELFSSSVIPDFDRNANGKLDKDELKAVGEQIRSSIAEWSFYTDVRSGAHDIAMQPPEVLDASYDAKAGKLDLSFTMKPEKPVDLTKEKLTFAVYDKSYFVAFDFPDERRFVLKKLPAVCKKKFVVPSPDEAASRWMNSVASFGVDQAIPDDGVNFSQVLATRLELDCRP